MTTRYRIACDEASPGTIGGPAPEEYRGFLGQMERGCDALVSVIGNLVLLFGLLLPWLGVAAGAAGIAYGLVRVLTGRTSSRGTEKAPDPPSAVED